MSAPSQEKKSKELKLEAKQLITRDQVMQNPKLMKLLKLIDIYGEITEKGLNTLIYKLKEKGIQFDYTFFKVGNAIVSKSLKEDILALLYVEFLETAGRAKKLKTTSIGKEALSLVRIPENEMNELKKAVEELRGEIAMVEAEVELQSKHLGSKK
ncbi:hypothetical protein [Fervidicoccus fontis]|uniref:Uncharacterized protein n=1 Tax=Fervidicoccus fontis (strain DSM 19380 / JCM 18336 / VKM B-2539 / Kam940) TaxID=1163730 RepID=I0A089_FERFK|nr:hypothetical protein [Fervidicoccus fontis]AFH42396.1 hypothetical protein FFONT_0406 [Fervidicoccus fontis Kam940]